jgi:hypothetical protein
LTKSSGKSWKKRENQPLEVEPICSECPRNQTHLVNRNNSSRALGGDEVVVVVGRSELASSEDVVLVLQQIKAPTRISEKSTKGRVEEVGAGIYLGDLARANDGIQAGHNEGSMGEDEKGVGC